MHSPSPSQSWQTFRIVYGAQILVLAIFGVVVFILIQQPGQVISPHLTDTFSYLLVFLGVAGVFLGHFIYNKQVARIDLSLDLTAKLRKLMVVTLVRSALWEFPGLFAGVASFVTGSVYLLLILVTMAVLMIFFRPTIDSVALDLQLSSNEKEALGR